jgi:2-polyprenyl-6-hydroxyphenyl methylase / 3-demethylubiquinone-9 3-methyltransferase
MEVVEHVADMSLFVRRCAEMVKPGGLMIVATLNRASTPPSAALHGRPHKI